MRLHPPRWRRAASLVTLLAILIPGRLPGQSTDPELAEGLRQVREGDFEGAVVTLDAVARRLTGDTNRRRDLIDVYVSLGVALVALEQRATAKDRFRSALALDVKLELSPARHSPKVLAAFAEARREAATEAAAKKAKGSPEAKARGGSSKLPWILLGAAGAAGGVVLLATRGGGASSGDGAHFMGASFSPAVIECPNGDINESLPVGITIFAQGGSSATTITLASTVLTIRNSPDVPSEIGTATEVTQTRITPSIIPAGGSINLRADTTLLCSNAPGNNRRYNEWIGRITLATDHGPASVETVNLLHVDIP